MDEEKSMIEYKESKGIFQWLKSKFEKLKEKFRPKANEIKTDEVLEESLSEEELENTMAGFDIRSNIGQNPDAFRDYIKLSEEDKKRMFENYDKMLFADNDSKDKSVQTNEDKEIE